MDKMITKHEIEQFSGTSEFYRHGLFRSMIYTDGIKYLIDNGCAWLVDVCCSAQIQSVVKQYKDQLQFWELKIDSEIPSKACVFGTVSTEEGELIIYRQQIEYTDCPCNVEIYVGPNFNDEGEIIGQILCLTGEN